MKWKQLYFDRGVLKYGGTTSREKVQDFENFEPHFVSMYNKKI